MTALLRYYRVHTHADKRSMHPLIPKEGLILLEETADKVTILNRGYKIVRDKAHIEAHAELVTVTADDIAFLDGVAEEEDRLHTEYWDTVEKQRPADEHYAEAAALVKHLTDRLLSQPEFATSA